MSSITVKNVPGEVHRAIRVRATRHRRSAQAEIRVSLESAMKPADRVKLGSLLVEIGRKAKLTDAEFACFKSIRDKTPAHAANFE